MNTKTNYKRGALRRAAVLRGSRRDSARSAVLLRGNKGSSETSEALLRDNKGSSETSAVLLRGNKGSSETSADKNISNNSYKPTEFMATKTLTTNYLTRLSNANHDGVTQQIDDRFSEFETDNQLFIAARTAVHQARQAEDIAFKRFSGKDFASDDLKREDALEDKYMSTALGILNGLLYLPETEPMRRKAQQARQVLKDFNFSTSDGFEAEARKVINMSQQWAAAQDYTLQELGIEAWVGKAVVQAQKVLQLVTVRVDHESAKVKGELAAARRATDEAIRKAYDVLNALAVLSPSAELSALINVLFGIEERAKLYYISGGGDIDGTGGDE